MIPSKAYAELKKRMMEISMLNSTAGVLHWDQEAYLPAKAVDHRAEQLAQISRLTHEWFTAPQVGELMDTIEASDLITDCESAEAVNVREWRRMYERETKLPVDLVEDFVRTTSKASSIWAEARKKSDFSLFQPSLERIVDLCRRKADFIGYDKEKYEALLDEFEPRAKVADIEKIYSGLRTELVELIGKIKDAPRKPDIGIIKRPYDLTRQKVFAESVSQAIGYDYKAGRFDEAVHASCNEMGPLDVRVLTRYYTDDIAEGLTSAMHEVGHALYDMTRPNKVHWGTPMGETASLGIHESQSRLWENMVGRSNEFWQYFFPQLQQLFRKELAGATRDDFYGAMNWVSPSYIRVEADEATYNLHVMLRFDMERAIIAGDIKVSDIPGEWNKRFKDYFGFEVNNDANGCLQDIHWSHGIFGYFPTYTLGNLYAAQYWSQALKDLPNLLDDFKRGQFSRLFEWLGEKIHTPGSKYDAPDLCRRVTGSKLSHKPLLDYLYEKYSGIYGISRN
ncbi:MAG: carboxypeptidase M32 [FCB group bacterium]|nr:carboxypeptidase M32 [FCB group bacterium]